MTPPKDKTPLKAPKPATEMVTMPAGSALDLGLRSLVGYALKRVAAATTADAARALEPFGLRVTTFSALSVICDNPDVTQSALAQSLAMERSNIVIIIDTLEEAGLIGRHSMPGDRRAYALRATLKGLRRRDAAMMALRENEARQLVNLSPDEQRELAQLLGRIEIRE
jgi:DNA-binding MarR family transcriptional regulator